MSKLVFIVIFWDTVRSDHTVYIDVLTANNNDVNQAETRTANFACLLNCCFFFKEYNCVVYKQIIL